MLFMVPGSHKPAKKRGPSKLHGNISLLKEAVRLGAFTEMHAADVFRKSPLKNHDFESVVLRDAFLKAHRTEAPLAEIELGVKTTKKYPTARAVIASYGKDALSYFVFDPKHPDSFRL